MANILVIGGSYFFGRWFVQVAYNAGKNSMNEKKSDHPDESTQEMNNKDEICKDSNAQGHAAGHNITVINRGNITIDLPGVIQYKSDRHDIDRLREIRTEMDAKGQGKFDCIVDFCAYEKKDIEGIATIFGNEGCRYIFISTVDVYAKKELTQSNNETDGRNNTLSLTAESTMAAIKTTDKSAEDTLSLTAESAMTAATASEENVYGNILGENAYIETRRLPGQVGEYISGKADLEKELVKVCEKLHMTGISVRPAILYGPANYAPRESMYFDWIEKAGQIITPIDSTGKFQFIYVADAARALLKLCTMDDGEIYSAYNFCTDEICTYEYFAKALHEAVPVAFEEVRLEISDIFAREIPLPFPLTDSESQVYDWNRFLKLTDKTTGLGKGLGEIYATRG